jgi:folylpolyglutamate synthase/dihydropteroate synthase
VAEGLAARVAQEMNKALRFVPNWHASANGRFEIHVWLFRTLVDGGHKSHSAELISDLLKELNPQNAEHGGRQFGS